jgi:hypothetical protein
VRYEDKLRQRDTWYGYDAISSVERDQLADALRTLRDAPIPRGQHQSPAYIEWWHVKRKDALDRLDALAGENK